MKYTIILLLLPLSLFSQKQNDFWLTSIADIEFINGKVNYCFSDGMPVFFGRITPISYPEDVLNLKPARGVGCLDQDAFNKLKKMIDEYLNDWSVQYADNRDEYRFLKLCCLRIIWSNNTQHVLPENAINALQVLNDDLNIETSKNAKLVIKLYNAIKQ